VLWFRYNAEDSEAELPCNFKFAKKFPN